METENGVKTVLISLTYENWLKLKELCYGGKSVSRLTTEIILRFIKDCENNSKKDE